jgi:hypothetical protein
MPRFRWNHNHTPDWNNASASFLKFYYLERSLPVGILLQYLVCLALIIVIFPGEYIITAENSCCAHLVPCSGYRHKHQL